MYLLWNLPFFKMVPPQNTFSSFFKPWADNSSQTSSHINRFMAGGWHSSCHSISKMHIVGAGPGEPPSALRGLSYLINNFLTDIKQLAKTSRGGTLHPPSDAYVRSFLCPFLCFNKTLLYKSSHGIKPGLWSRSLIFFGDHESNTVHHKLSKRSLVFPILLFFSISLHWSLRKAF